MDMTPCGFPHSEICGSKLICSSPQLIAAYHVFHRLSVPRHSPCALSSLTSILCSILNICQRDFLRHCRFITYFRLKISFAEFLLFSVFSFQGTLNIHSLPFVKFVKLLSQFAEGFGPSKLNNSVSAFRFPLRLLTIAFVSHCRVSLERR